MTIGSLRITPAYAGKRKKPLDKRYTLWDHPRLRGEKFITYPFCLYLRGSPPLTRGKEPTIFGVQTDQRITPAYAGKRILNRSKLTIIKDHPRLRGEKFSIRTFNLCLMGSPPLTRGKAPRDNLNKTLAGITPAYAGKRFFLRPLLFLEEDHPRLRGEKVAFIVICFVIQGSPPLTRGKVMIPFLISCTARITPAYAGKRLDKKIRDLTFEDHPRLRGEKFRR